MSFRQPIWISLGPVLQSERLTGAGGGNCCGQWTVQCQRSLVVSCDNIIVYVRWRRRQQQVTYARRPVAPPFARDGPVIIEVYIVRSQPASSHISAIAAACHSAAYDRSTQIIQIDWLATSIQWVYSSAGMETETQYYASRRSQNPVTFGFAMPSMPPEEAPITCSFTNHSLSDALRWSQMSDKKRTLFESLYAEIVHFTKTGSGQT